MAKSNTKGLSLIGVLVAVLVFATMLLAILGLMGRTIREVGRSRENFIATNLAREGLELVQFVRDTNMLRATEWTGNAFGDPLCDGDGQRELIVDRQNDIIRVLALPAGQAGKSGPENTQLYMDGSNYQHDATNTVVPYHRQIVIDCSTRAAANDEHIQVESKVNWESRGGQHTVVLRTNLYHWYQ